MATKIILTVDEGLTDQEVQDLRYLLADALGDFALKRDDAHAWVDQSDPDRRLFPEDSARAAKVAQVMRRVQLARKLHNAALGFTVREFGRGECPNRFEERGVYDRKGP